MKDSPRKGEEGRPVGRSLDPKIPEEVKHDRGAEGGDETEGKTADSPDLLFELAGMAGFGRKMAWVVDAGGQFVDEKFAVGEFEEFDAEQADKLELVGDSGGEGDGGGSGCGGSASGEDGAFQNTSLVAVLEGREWDGKIGGLAGDEDR